VSSVVRGWAASGVLRKGHGITAVDGKPVTCRASVGTLIKARAPGAPAVLTVDRHGTTHHFRLKTANSRGHAVVGVGVFESYRFPFQVKISVGDIGGPGAGPLFAPRLRAQPTPRAPPPPPLHPPAPPHPPP